MGYRLIIFDFDGTLADSLPFVVSILDEIAEQYRLPRVTADQIDQFRRTDAGQVMRFVNVPFWKIPLIAADVRRRMAKEIHQIRLFEGIDQVIQGLAGQGKQLAVVSSNATSNIRQVLGAENAGLIRLFEGGISAFGKPPKIRKVMRRLHVSPAETLLIGDEIRDIQAARKAGVACGVVSWGYTHLSALESYAPEIIFRQVDEILKKVT